MYELLYSKQASKFIKKQDQLTKNRLKKALLTLAESPYERGNLDIKLLKGTGGAFRLRVGDFRIIYEIKDEELVILVMTAGSRGDMYK